MLWLEVEPFGHQPWAQAYKRVVLERDSSKIGFRIEMAKTAIASRLAEFSKLPNLTRWRREINAINHTIDFLGERIAEAEALRTTRHN